MAHRRRGLRGHYYYFTTHCKQPDDDGGRALAKPASPPHGPVPRAPPELSAPRWGLEPAASCPPKGFFSRAAEPESTTRRHPGHPCAAPHPNLTSPTSPEDTPLTGTHQGNPKAAPPTPHMAISGGSRCPQPRDEPPPPQNVTPLTQHLRDVTAGLHGSAPTRCPSGGSARPGPAAGRAPCCVVLCSPFLPLHPKARPHGAARGCPGPLSPPQPTSGPLAPGAQKWGRARGRLP